MAKKLKKTDKTTSKKLKKTMVAGREIDPTPVTFEKVDFSDIQEELPIISRTSKYADLVMAVLELEDGEAIKVPSNGKDIEKFRMNIAMVINNKVKPRFDKDHKLRIRKSSDNESVIITCHVKDAAAGDDEDEDSDDE